MQLDKHANQFEIPITNPWHTLISLVELHMPNLHCISNDAFRYLEPSMSFLYNYRPQGATHFRRNCLQRLRTRICIRREISHVYPWMRFKGIVWCVVFPHDPFVNILEARVRSQTKTKSYSRELYLEVFENNNLWKVLRWLGFYSVAEFRNRWHQTLMTFITSLIE